MISKKLDGGVISKDLIISSSEKNKKKSIGYKAFAPANQYYYMEAYLYTGSNTLNVSGNYTP